MVFDMVYVFLTGVYFILLRLIYLPTKNFVSNFPVQQYY